MEEIIKELGLKIDQFKTETCTKAELIELMSKVSDLETKGEDVATLKANTEELALKVLELETKGIANKNVPQNLSTLLTEKAEELKAMSKKLSLPEINKQMDMERIKKENPSLYASIQQKNKQFNKTVKK